MFKINELVRRGVQAADAFRHPAMDVICGDQIVATMRTRDRSVTCKTPDGVPSEMPITLVRKGVTKIERAPGCRRCRQNCTPIKGRVI